MRALSLKRRRDMKEQRWQFIAVFVTVALGVMMFGASYDAYKNLTISYAGTYERLAFADATVIGDSPQLTSALQQVDGVAKVITRTQADVALRVGTDILIGRIVAVPAGDQPAIDQLDVTDGEYPASGATGSALIETHMADHFSLAPGDTVEVLTVTGWEDVDLTGVAVSPEYLWPARSNQQFFEPAGSFGVLFVTPDVAAAVDPTKVVPQTLVLYDAAVDPATVDADVKSVALANGGSSVELQADQPSNKGLNLDVTGFEQMAVFFPAMFLLAAGLAAYALLTRLVYSQRSIIGTLRANGFSRKAVLRHYLAYGLWLGTAGSLVGVALALPAGWAITAAYTAELGIPDTIRELRWVTPVLGLLFGVVVGTLSAWVPARAAVRISPAEAIRGDIEVRPGHVSLLERIFPPLRRLPVHWRMVLRGIGRSKRRSLSVILGIVLAMTLVFTAWGLVDTTRILLDRQFTEVMQYDADVLTSVPVDDALVSKIAAVDGVSRAESSVSLQASVRGSDGTYSTVLFAFDADTQVHGFVTEHDTRPGTGAIIGAAMVDKIGAGIGDTVEISLPGLDAKFDSTVDDLVTEPMGSPVYVTREVLEKELDAAGVQDVQTLIEQPGISSIQVVFDSGVDRAQVLDRIRKVDGVALTTDAQAIYTQIQSYMGLFYIFVGMMLVFGGILALALIFNIVSVNLAERTTELAVMRANGLSSRRIAQSVLAENMILTALGLIPGIAAAYGAASWLMSTYTSDMLSFNLEFYPSSLILSGLSMFLVTAVSLWPGLRAVRRLDIATEVRKRSQ